MVPIADLDVLHGNHEGFSRFGPQQLCSLDIFVKLARCLCNEKMEWLSCLATQKLTAMMTMAACKARINAVTLQLPY